MHWSGTEVLDRAWFARWPERDYRVRPPALTESNDFCHCERWQSHRQFAIVRRIDMAVFCFAIPLGLSIEDTDEFLEMVFE